MASPRRGHKHSTLARNLKSLGLLPAGYRPKSLTKAQKDYVVRLVKKYPGPSFHPKEFVSRRVSGRTARILKAAEYNVKLKGERPVAVFAKHGAERIKVSREGIIREQKGLTRKSLIYSRADVFNQAEAFFKRRKPGQYLMVSRAGGPGGFHIRSMGAFLRYMEHLEGRVKSKIGPKYWGQLESELYIIEVTPE